MNVTIHGYNITCTPEEFNALVKSSAPTIAAPPPVTIPRFTAPQTPAPAPQQPSLFVANDADVDAVLAPSDFRKRKLVRLYDFIPANGRGVETGRPLLFSLKKSGFPIVGRTVSTEVQQITDMLSILERLGLIVRAVPRGHTVFKNASISRPDAILAISELRTGAHGKLVKQTA